MRAKTWRWGTFQFSFFPSDPCYSPNEIEPAFQSDCGRILSWMWNLTLFIYWHHGFLFCFQVFHHSARYTCDLDLFDYARYCARNLSQVALHSVLALHFFCLGTLSRAVSLRIWESFSDISHTTRPDLDKLKDGYRVPWVTGDRSRTGRVLYLRGGMMN